MNFSFWPFLWFGLPGRLLIIAAKIGFWAGDPKTPSVAGGHVCNFRHLLENPIVRTPSLRTLLRTLWYCKTPSQRPSENPSSEPFPEPSQNPSQIRNQEKGVLAKGVSAQSSVTPKKTENIQGY